jgi:hypothetical protein
LDSPLAQWLEQGTHNPLVLGSNPRGTTNSITTLRAFSSTVEQLTFNQLVLGSNPRGPTISTKQIKINNTVNEKQSTFSFNADHPEEDSEIPISLTIPILLKIDDDNAAGGEDTSTPHNTRNGALFEVDRFDIESEIMEISNFSEILKNYADAIYDGEFTDYDSDSIHTTLHGFANLLIGHSEKMYRSHEKHYKLNAYSES